MRHGRAPDRHDRIADELLDGAAVEVDDLRRGIEVAREELANRLRVAVLRERREADEVGEQDRHKPPLSGRDAAGRIGRGFAAGPQDVAARPAESRVGTVGLAT